MIGLGVTVGMAVTGDDPAPRIVAAPGSGDHPGVMLSPRPVAVTHRGFTAWALLDRHTGRITGSPNQTQTSDTMSMVKAWLVADYLRQAFARAHEPSDRALGRLGAIIRDSANPPTDRLYSELGRDASIRRMIAMCGLTETRPGQGRWSNTVTSARDTVRLGLCVADGRAAGPRWTAWVLDRMREVRGAGDFGIREALHPSAAARVSIKNGWLLRDEDRLWHVSCLAIGADWVVGVLARYPSHLGLAHGRDVCKHVGTQLLLRGPHRR